MADGYLEALEHHERERNNYRRTMSMVRWLLYLAFIVIGWLIIKRLAPVLTPILAAAGIAYLLDPLVDRLEARGMNRATAVALLLVAFLTVVTVAIVCLVPLLADDITRLIADAPEMLDTAVAWAANVAGYEMDSDGWRAIVSEDEFKSLLQQAAAPMFSFAVAIVGGVLSFAGFLAEMLLIPVFAFYFLLDWKRMLRRIAHVIPGRHRDTVLDVASEIDGVVAGWIRGQLTVTSILAVLYALAFKVIGLPLAISLGLGVGLLTIVPFVGTIAGATITIALLLIDWHGPIQLIAVGGVFIVLHLLEAAILTPRLVGHRVGLGEVGALFAVLAGGKLLGFTGVLLAVPLAAALGVVVRRVFRYYEGSGFFTDGAMAAFAEGAAEIFDEARGQVRASILDPGEAPSVRPPNTEDTEHALAGSDEQVDAGSEGEDSDESDA